MHQETLDRFDSATFYNAEEFPGVLTVDISGPMGIGKTFLTEKIKELMEEEGREVVVCRPNSNTGFKDLMRELPKNCVLIVDHQAYGVVSGKVRR